MELWTLDRNSEIHHHYHSTSIIHTYDHHKHHNFANHHQHASHQDHHHPCQSRLVVCCCAKKSAGEEFGECLQTQSNKQQMALHIIIIINHIIITLTVFVFICSSSCWQFKEQPIHQMEVERNAMSCLECNIVNGLLSHNPTPSPSTLSPLTPSPSTSSPVTPSPSTPSPSTPSSATAQKHHDASEWHQLRETVQRLLAPDRSQECQIGHRRALFDERSENHFIERMEI